MSDGNNLVRTFEVKDGHGRVVETKEAVTYAGLLNRAHQEGLRGIRTKLVQVPSAGNEMTAISMAEVVTDKGVFRDYGDANPTNVDAKIIPHIIRMSVTRAKARALRDAINVGVVSLEELGQEMAGSATNGEARSSPTNRTASPVQTKLPRDPNAPMTSLQYTCLLRFLGDRGMNGTQADIWLCQQTGVGEAKKLTVQQAADLITQLQSKTSDLDQKPN